MKIACVILLAVLVASPAYSWEPDPWSKTDIALEILSQGLLLVDWGQSLDITKRDEYYEKNAYLGKNPSRSKVNAYFALSCLTHAGITWMMPASARVFGLQFSPRRAWQYAYIGYESSFVANNYQLGLKVSF